MNRRGFTLIEVLTVVSIIAILAALLVVGVGKLQTTAKRRQTEQVLANCQAMFGDWEAYSRQTFSREPMACPNNVTPALALQNMGSYVYDQYHRYGDATIFTQDVMYHLKTMPTNAAALAKLPANALTSWPNGLAIPKPTGSDVPTAYTYAGRWAYTDGSGNISWYAPIQSSTSAVTPPDPAYWLSEAPVYNTAASSVLAQPIPLPQDGWGNPIIFVPYQLGSGAALTTTTYPIMPMGALMAATTTFQPKSPDGRPFFASAGPDGDFSLGDDNLYSFEH